MSKLRGRHHQRAVMASDAEWARIGRKAQAAGMERSRYVVGRALGDEGLAPAVRHRALRQGLVRARARAAGKTISRYVLDLVRADLDEARARALRAECCFPH